MKPTTTALLALSIVGLATSLGAATPQENWDLHCAKCHSADGSGSTKIGQKLKLKDYSKKDLQAAFTDAEALAAIRDGVKDPSGKVVMNPYAEKLTAEEMQALVGFVRGLAKN
jgi:cytochrome c553